MKIIDRYLARTVLTGSFLAFLVLLALAAFFAFIDQLGDLRGGYTVLKAMEYVFFVLPTKSYELFHTAILLGSLMSLGAMANNSELIILRTAGISIAQIAFSVIKAGVILMLFGIFLGEVVAPPAEQHAQKLKTAAITGSDTIQSGNGIWSKNRQEFVHVGQVYPDAVLTGVEIYSFNEKHQLISTLKVERATFKDPVWQLEKVTETIFQERNFKQNYYPSMERDKLVQPEMLDTLSVKEQELSLLALYRYIRHLSENQLDSSKYELAFWMKVIKPFSVIIMLLIALPFVFGSLRSSSVGQRLLIGVLLGLGFHMFNQALNYIGVGYGLNAIVSAALPTLLFAIAAIWSIRRIH
jgi:lipopolysaccharide export system permease protein